MKVNIIKNKSFLIVLFLVLGIVVFLFDLLTSSFAINSEVISGDITLLAVNEEDTDFGSTLTLHLTISPGDGDTYFDSFPLSKMDTIASIRFAREFACDFLNLDCKKLDFFYKIRSDTFVVEGPSAGVSFALLTILLLHHLKEGEFGYYDYSWIALTGTINAGGFIGPVGGLQGKINAGLRDRNVKFIFVPDEKINDSNSDFENCKKINSKTVCKVNTIYDVLKILKILEDKTKEFERLLDYEPSPPDYYYEIMDSIAVDLCKRTEILLNSLNKEKQEYANKNNLTDRYEKGKLAYNSRNFYSAASLCLTSSINLQKLNLTHEYILKLDFNNLTNETKEDINAILKNEFEKLSNLADDLNKKIVSIKKKYSSKKIYGITDFQTKLITLNRLEDAQQTLSDALDLLSTIYENYSSLPFETNFVNYLNLVDKLAYAIERTYTVELWARFFGHDKDKVELNPSLLRELCLKKLSESYEAYNFVKYYLGTLDDNELQKAYEYYKEFDYASCIFYATLMKSKMNSYMSASENLTKSTEVVLKLLKYELNSEIFDGYFPILGYSYYEYSKTLLNFDPESAFIYSQEGLEFSEIHNYFRNDLESPQINETRVSYDLNQIKTLKKTTKTLILLLILSFILYFVLLSHMLYLNKKWKKMLKEESVHLERKIGEKFVESETSKNKKVIVKKRQPRVDKIHKKKEKHKGHNRKGVRENIDSQEKSMKKPKKDKKVIVKIKKSKDKMSQDKKSKHEKKLKTPREENLKSKPKKVEEASEKKTINKVIVKRKKLKK